MMMDKLYSCGYVLSAFYSAFTLARLCLPRLNAKIGERRALLCYVLSQSAITVVVLRAKSLIMASAAIAVIGLLQGT